MTTLQQEPYQSGSEQHTREKKGSIGMVVVGVIGIFIMVLVSFLYYQNMQLQQRIVQLENNPAEESDILPVITPLPININTSSSTCEQDAEGWCVSRIGTVDWESGWSGFIVHYPPEWKFFSEERASSSEQGVGSVSVELSNENVTMEILQAAVGGGSCEYTTEPSDQGGNFQYFESFTDIVRSDGLQWRNSLKQDKDDISPWYFVCQFDSTVDRFTTNTAIGVIMISDRSGAYNPQHIATLNQVLQKIELAQ